MSSLEIQLIISIVINIAYWFITNKLRNENKGLILLLEETEQMAKDYKQTLERENYLLKTMNDAMKVTNTKGFIAQRMSMAPKLWKPKSIKEIKPDEISG